LARSKMDVPSDSIGHGRTRGQTGSEIEGRSGKGGVTGVVSKLDIGLEKGEEGPVSGI